MIIKRFPVTFLKKKFWDDILGQFYQNLFSVMNGNWIHDLFFHEKRKNNCFANTLKSHALESWNWVLILITGLSKSSDLGILLQETHSNICPTSLVSFKKIWVKNLEILQQQNASQQDKPHYRLWHFFQISLHYDCTTINIWNLYNGILPTLAR